MENIHSYAFIHAAAPGIDVGDEDANAYSKLFLAVVTKKFPSEGTLARGMNEIIDAARHNTLPTGMCIIMLEDLPNKLGLPCENSNELMNQKFIFLKM